LLDLRRSGAAIVLVSEELDEITSLSDRIAVIYEGQIVGETEGEVSDEERERIGLMMTGQYEQQAASHEQQDEAGAHDD
jgi:simple sugar transport system ATP-binding protein